MYEIQMHYCEGIKNRGAGQIGGGAAGSVLKKPVLQYLPDAVADRRGNIQRISACYFLLIYLRFIRAICGPFKRYRPVKT